MMAAQDTSRRHGNAPRRKLGAIRAALKAARQRAKLLLLVHAIGLLAAGAAAALTAAVLIDALLRFPAPLRWAIALALLALLGLWVVRHLLPALRFRPKLTVLALRLEKVDAAKTDGGSLQGLLTSALELERDRHDPGPLTSSLREEVAARALRAFKRSDAVKRLVRPAGAMRGLGMIAAAAALITLGVWMFPQGAQTGLARVLTPWRDVRWPSRTDIEPGAIAEVHPADRALPVRGVLLRAPGDPSRAEVIAHYRVTGDGWRGPSRRVMLSAQNARAAAPNGREGVLFERLIEPSAFLPPEDAGAGDATERTVEFWLETADDRTPVRRIRVVDPPALRSASASIDPPDYARGLLEGTGFVRGRADLGDGGDERALLGPILAGSRVELEWTFSKPLAGAGDNGGTPAWLADLREAGAFEFERDGPDVRAAGVLERSARIEVAATGADGLPIRDEPVFAIEAEPDRAPTAAVTEPPRDERVLATAVIDLSGEGRDDLGLERVWLNRQIARPPEGSVGAAPEPAEGDGGEVIADRAIETGAVVRQTGVGAVLDLSTLGVETGDEVWITAMATDRSGDGPGAHEPGASPVRVLRIISETELIEQIRGTLDSVRRAAIRLDEQQAELERAARRAAGRADDAPSEEERAALRERARTGQAGLSERVGVQLEAVRALRERGERNALDDEALEGLLRDAQGALEQAGERSAEAAEALGEAERSEGQRQEEAEREAGEAQADVRNELGSLVRLLDRGEDGWLVRRGVERLLEDQRALSEATEKMGNETIGRSREELSERELSDLERIAQRQRELAERARRALDELSERGRQMEQADPAQSAAMKQAASAGRQAAVPERLEEAAEQIGENQTTSARGAQREAEEALEQALEELDNAERNRDRQLQRQAADLAESIEQLVEAQRRELTSVELARDDGGDPAALAEGMVRLNGNTLGVAAEAGESGFAELEELRGLLEDASAAQGAAITLLRADPADLEGAEENERVSLGKLEAALEVAERAREQAEQREQERAKQELRKAYSQVLEQQVALRGETEGYTGRDLPRRERGEVRGLGQRQQTLRERMRGLLEDTEGLSEALVFELAHEQYDTLAGDAADALRRGLATAGVLDTQDRAVEIVTGLVEALRENRGGNEDEFASGGGGGGGGAGGGGQGPLIESIQQLKLIRALQQQVASLTRDVDASDEGRVGGMDAESLGQMQQRLADTAQDLIEEIRAQQQQQGRGGGP